MSEVKVKIKNILTDEEKLKRRREQFVAAKRKQRQSPEFRKKEVERTQKYRKRKKEERETQSKRTKTETRAKTDWSEVCKKYFEEVADGPIHKCVCCDELRFETETRAVHKSQIGNFARKLVDFPSKYDAVQFCLNCYRRLEKKKISLPYRFQDVPDCLKNLEDKILSVRSKLDDEAISFLLEQPLYENIFNCKELLEKAKMVTENLFSQLNVSSNEAVPEDVDIFFAEEFLFPKIYAGRPRPICSDSKYENVVKSEIRRSDRRAASPAHVRFAHLVIQHLRIKSCRRVKSYDFLKSIPGSPLYWRDEKNKLLSTIRLLGSPTLLITVTETNWPDLTRLLEEDEKRRRDPVTRALYFDHRLRALTKTWDCPEGPIGKVSHWYYRIKFQKNGPQARVLVWIENAPRFTKSNLAECENFIDKTYTCSRDNEFSFLQKGSRVYFPMDECTVLTPAKDETMAEKHAKIAKTLPDVDPSLSFDAFLSFLALTKEEYVDVLRAGIDSPTVFLKRRVDEIFFEAYCPTILDLMQSNTSVRFVTEGYACASRVIDDARIKKSNRENVDFAFKVLCKAKTLECAWRLLDLPLVKYSEKKSNSA